jgi:hypothetical protein
MLSRLSAWAVLVHFPFIIFVNRQLAFDSKLSLDGRAVLTDGSVIASDTLLHAATRHHVFASR